MRWSTLNQMETGLSHDVFRQRKRVAVRRRRRTLAGVGALLCAFIVHLCVWYLSQRAAALGVKGGQQCWPLAGRHVPAVVLVPSGRVLWRPRYTPDEAPGDVFRAHETSVLCPAKRTKIRPKRVNVTHGLFQHDTFADKSAVCLAHYMDFFAHGKCL